MPERGAVTNVDAVRRGIEELLSRHETEPEHVRHVCRLSLELHDALQSIHGLGSEERLLLEFAALLHDIGWSATQPDGKGHHKESARMILEHPWTGLDARGIALCAQIARYHRKAVPDVAHPEFAALSAPDRRRVRWLSAILRVGDALDRRHVRRVARATATAAGKTLRVTATGDGEIGAELEAANRTGDLLRALWPGDVAFDADPGRVAG